MKNLTFKHIYYFSLAIIFVSVFLLSFTKSNTAYACTCCNCIEPVAECSLGTCACTSIMETGVEPDNQTTIGHIFQEFLNHEEWLVTTVFQDHVLPSMMLMANQISTIALQQAQIIGTFFDAKHQLESQRLLQQLQAQAHKDYHPSIGMCRFGTNTRSLVNADSFANFNHIALAARNTHRILMTGGAIGTGSARDDTRSRLVHFRETYCNPHDFGNSLADLCNKGGTVGRRNKDIEYTDHIQNQDTLLIDFTDDSDTPDEEDVLALSANLYGTQLISYIPEVHMAEIGGDPINSGQFVYMDTRALAAKRSVAFNSFAAQTAMKSEGGEEVTPYATQILEEMGVPADSITKMLKERPSYHAQMELLTKKLYQFPNFYSNLYDKPINVDRKDVAMQAIALMQKRDMYRSQLRSEANMAVWLETLLEDLQQYHENEADLVKQKQNKIILNLGL